MFNDIENIHFVGIGGIGMSAVAKWFHLQDKTVSGSDLHMSEETDALKKMGITVSSGHAKKNVTQDVELVVYSPAVPPENVERDEARDTGIQQMSYPELLGKMSKAYSTIAVTGTHGKSTTTAMLGSMLADAGYDPTVIVGSKVDGFEHGNLRMGDGRFLVLEACEYRAHMLEIDPEMIVLTNIHADHLDYYRNIDDIRDAFQSFVDKLEAKGLLIYNAEDKQSNLLETTRGVSFGFTPEADYVSSGRSFENETQTFDFTRTHDGREEDMGEVEMSLPGEYNAYNASAALAAAVELGVPFHSCQATLRHFKALWRRFERVGEWKGADVYSDYGHHPDEVLATIEATKELFPDRRVVLCFQPHQHARTKKLFKQFVEALGQADHDIIVPEIYTVSGRTESTEVSSRHIVEAMLNAGFKRDVRYAEDLDKAEAHLREIVKPEDVVVFQGAGNIDDLARKLAG
jgi:UDP-N-acetylmuramate--alanine ligase